jgi:hypothetical protein
MPVRLFLLVVFLGNAFAALAQPKTPADFGYRHLRMRYQRDTVDILVLSKKGEELKRKPLLFFAQGSLPKPLLLYNEHSAYPVFVFAGLNSQYLDNYHFAIAGKPGVPVVAATKALQPDFTYNDPRTASATTSNTTWPATKPCCITWPASPGSMPATSRQPGILKEQPS